MKALRFIEKMLIVLAVIGGIMKFSGGIGGGIFIVVSLLLLALVYFLTGIILFRDKESSAGNLGLSALTGLALTLAVGGILLKVQYWPGAQTNLLGGMVLCIPAVVMATSYRKNKQPNEGMDNYFRSITRRCLITISFCAILLCIPQSTLIRFEYRADPKHAELMVNYLADPENKSALTELMQYEMGSYAP
jgi:hypothetical protein